MSKQSEEEQNTRLNLNLSGMTCAACALKISDTLNSVEGVKHAEVVLTTESATLDIDESKVDIDQILQSVKAIGYKAKACRAMRTDGAYIEAGEQDNLIVQKLQNDAESFGIFGFSYLDQNSDTLQGAILSGVEPSFEAIAEGKYKASRALYFYVKHNHMGVVPGVQEYMEEWTKHWGDDGALADAGMIPMPENERLEMLERVSNLVVLTENDLINKVAAK